MAARLPFLLSIPHGGLCVPECVADRIAIDQTGILEDADCFTPEIYDLSEQVAAVVRADVARAIVDLNRDVSEMPPDFPDGVIKSMTCCGKPVYRQGCFPGPALVDELLAKYYRPYHETLNRRQAEAVIGFDCHSMASKGPPLGPDPGQPRPVVNLGNVHGRSCEMRVLELLADCFRDVFKLDQTDISLNAPFAGGYITRTYGMHEIRWIQIELNRSLYLADDACGLSDPPPLPRPVEELRAMVLDVFQRFYHMTSGQFD